jgi:hypothetical protein
VDPRTGWDNMKRKIICPCWDSKSSPLAVQPVTILTVLLAVTITFEYFGTGKHREAYEAQVSHCIEVCAIMLPGCVHPSYHLECSGNQMADKDG